jgi:hypothetical protein
MKSLHLALLLSPLLAAALVPVGAADEKAPAKDGQGEPAKAAAVATGAVRQRFVPQKKGKDEGNHASGTKLSRGMLEPGQLTAMAHLGLDDVFPVRDEHGQKLFEIHLTDGNDQHLVLEIRAKEVVQKIAVACNEATDVVVGGLKYELYYPATEVGPNDPPTTAQAMIIISQRP